MRNYPKSQRFPAEEVDDLIAQYRGDDLTGDFPWIKYLEPEQAREEILVRFRNLVHTLLTPCLTGKYTVFSSYQVKFLRTWAGKTVPLENIALTLKNEFSGFDKEELELIGDQAILLSLEKVKTNLASTIVTTLKDLLFEIIKNKDSHLTYEYQDYHAKTSSIEDNAPMKIALDSLDRYEMEIVEKFLDPDDPLNELPTELKDKLKKYLADE